MRKLVPIAFLVVLGACASPSDGPSATNIRNASLPNSNEKIPVVELADAPLGIMGATTMSYASNDAGLSSFRSGGYVDSRLRRGDVIDVTIFDTGEEGILSTTNSKTLNLGRFTVDESGFVTLPFVGRQRVMESSPEALQSRIVAGLKGSAVNPQAVVSVVEKPANGITVNGNVRAPGRFPLTARKERVLDAIALAGGASGAPGGTTVTIVRGKQRASASLDRIMADSRQNVYLLPDDQVMLEGDAPSFMALGAFKSAGEFEFEKGKLTLAQALGRAGGLLDDRADARNFYVFRNQPVYSDAAFAKAGKNPGAPFVTSKPVIYRVNLKDVSNFALMQQFQVQDGDILFASNAGLVDAAKLITVFQKSVATAAAPPPGGGN
ncbi:MULTISPECIES: polysaccharide biosynthesis/export family protein [unclassified Mesorhizobium]|uniref:polysaccharide biosynthesis/export family protein n=1 Tax=unclassified Mesorhizobium TaxID=325217 RepID=UPI00301510CC